MAIPGNDVATLRDMEKRDSNNREKELLERLRYVEPEGLWKKGPVPHWHLCGRIIQQFFYVARNTRWGLPEHFYANALEKCLERTGLRVEREVEFIAYFEGEPMGRGRIDMLVEGLVVVENKATRLWESYFNDQALAYLAHTDFEVGLLLHFGLKPNLKRFAFSNEFKNRGVPG